MNIIILGAGQVGGTLAEILVKEDNDVTVVDIDEKRLHSLQSRLDIRTVVGQSSHPDIMQMAGGENADMVIAVTSNDETNMVACQVAYTLFRVPRKIARIRSNSYLTHPELFQPSVLPIDVCIYPEQLVTHYVQRLIENPGTLQVLDFAGGAVRLMAVKVGANSFLSGKTLTKLHEAMPQIKMRIAALFRKNQSIPLAGETEIKNADEIFFISAADQAPHILSALHLDAPYRNIIIGGGGHIGLSLASSLESRYNVKVIDFNNTFAELAAKTLHHSTVLCGDVCDRELLLEENIDSTDIFCAVTNDDEANIMSCIQAKRLGVRKVMALITRTAYVDLIEGSEIDIAISPQQATIGSILTHLRQGDIVGVHSLRRGAAEAIEIVVHGDSKTSKVVGRSIGHIKFPTGTTVGAIARGDQILIAHPELVIEPGDHVILCLADKSSIHEVERLFQVSVSSFFK